MSYLMANWRRRSLAVDVEVDALGRAIQGWAHTSSFEPDKRWGGLVVFSFASQLSGVGFFQISAYEAMTSVYGATLVSNILGSGFKFIPMWFQDFSGVGDGTNNVFYAVSATQALSVGNNSVAVIGVRKQSYTVGTGLAFTSASNVSVHFICGGFIVSAPDGYK